MFGNNKGKTERVNGEKVNWNVLGKKVNVTLLIVHLKRELM